MIISIDLDEVLADTTPALIRYHNATYGTSLTFEDFTNYEWWRVWGGTREQSVRKFLDFVKSPFFSEVRPVQGAEDAVKKLKEHHTLHIVTSRQTELESVTHSWIETYFPGVFTGIHMANHAQWALSGKTRTKVEICLELDAALLIEDSLLYARECESDNIPVLLLDYPWNKGALPTNTKRVLSWREIVQHIEK